MQKQGKKFRFPWKHSVLCNQIVCYISKVLIFGFSCAFGHFISTKCIRNAIINNANRSYYMVNNANRWQLCKICRKSGYIAKYRGHE